MGRARCAIMLLAGCLLAARGQAEDVSCKTETAQKDGSSRGLELKLTLDHGRPTGMSFSSWTATGEEGGAYFCTLEARADNRHQLWKQQAAVTSVTILAGNELDQDPDKESKFEIVQTKLGYTVKFTSMSRTYCGFGAEFPESATLVVGRKTCRDRWTSAP